MKHGISIEYSRTPVNVALVCIVPHLSQLPSPLTISLLQTVMADTHLHVLLDNGNIVIVERLRGPENYHKWLAQFEAAAEQKGYSTLFSGQEKLVFRPDINTYIEAFKHRSTAHNAMTILSTSEAVPNFDQSLLTSEYELDSEEYESREQRARCAVILLYGSVDYDLRGIIRGFDDPRIAMDALKKRFGSIKGAESPQEHKPQHTTDEAASAKTGAAAKLPVRLFDAAR